MHGRFAAAVPIAMWNACSDYHKSSRTGLISLTRDLQAHGAAEDVEPLVDRVLVEARWLHPSGRSLLFVGRTNAGGQPCRVFDASTTSASRRRTSHCYRVLRWAGPRG